MPNPLLRCGAIFLAAAIAFFTTACNSGARAIDTSYYQPPLATTVFDANSTMARLQQTGTLRIGTKFDQPLFGLRNPLTGRPQGFDAEMGTLIAAQLGIPATHIQWVETVSANREPFLNQGRVDMVIATYTITEERKRIIGVAGPYYIAGQSFLVPAGNPEQITGPDDLRERKVCAVEGSASSSHIRTRVPQADLVLFDSYSKCAQAVRNHQVAAMTTDNTILAGLRSREPNSFDLVDSRFTEEPYGIGVAKDNADLVTFIDTLLRESFTNGSWAAAWNRTAGTILGSAPTPPDLNSY